MPDLLGYKLTKLSAVSVSLPRVRIEGRFVDSDTQATTLADFTGTTNGLVFPAVITTLTAVQQDALTELIATYLLRAKAGLTDPATGR